jgi:hypothetical protein
MSARTEALAKRIEQGAEQLASYAEGLSDAEWTTPVTPARDGRPVGVIVHHVASVYPIEVQLAQAIGSGKAMSDVTWDVVRKMNADHATANGSVSKSDALDLLRKNSSEAANAVRAMTDEQLDTAAPFGLSFDAPVTAQFVIEDHALRHSWHHLARIRETLGK